MRPGLELDHGVYSWLPYLLEPPWPVKVLPIAVNMLMHPVPTPERLRALGASLRRALLADSGERDVVVLATDGINRTFLGGLLRPLDSPQHLAERILRRHGKGTDDALVLVTRYRGAEGGR